MAELRTALLPVRQLRHKLLLASSRGAFGMNLSEGRPTYSIGIHILDQRETAMSRLSNRVLAGLSASAFAVLMSQTAMAGLVNVHVSVPTIRIPVPTARVAVPTIQVKTSAFKTTNLTANRSVSHRDHRDGNADRGGHGAPVVTATYHGAPVGAAVYGTTHVPPGRNPPKGGGNGGITVVGTTVPGNNVPPPGVYNPNCDGAADCGIVTVPVTVVTIQTPPTPPSGGPAAAFLGTTTCQAGRGGYWSVTISNSDGQVSVSINEGIGPGPKYTATVTANPNGSFTVTFTNLSAGPPTGEPESITLVPGANGGPWTITSFAANDGNDAYLPGFLANLTCTSSA
jgi:hypothetical protein